MGTMVLCYRRPVSSRCRVLTVMTCHDAFRFHNSRSFAPTKPQQIEQQNVIMPSSSSAAWTAHRLDNLVLSTPEIENNAILWCYPEPARQRLASRFAALLSRNGGVLRHADWYDNSNNNGNGALSAARGGQRRQRVQEQAPAQHKRVREFWNQAVLEVSFYLRHVTLRADLLSSKKLSVLAQALRTSPHLTSLTWQGHGEGLSQKIATVLVMGVAKNPHGN